MIASRRPVKVTAIMINNGNNSAGPKRGGKVEKSEKKLVKDNEEISITQPVIAMTRVVIILFLLAGSKELFFKR